MSSEKLFPCPNLECSHEIQPSFMCTSQAPAYDQVTCPCCGLIGPTAINSTEEAARLWNSLPRHESPAVKALVEALENIRNELGVPQPGYPQPVANASFIATKAIAAYKRETLRERETK